MKAVYVDNFRGFSDTLIPIERVNFLLGENSTGKSSILSLIYLLGGRNFWFNNNEFNSDEVSMGSFEDLVSSDSPNKNKFTVGFFSEGVYSKRVKEKDNSEKIRMGHCVNTLILTFSNSNGSPNAQRLTYSVAQKIITVTLSKKGIFYKIFDGDAKEVSLDNFRKIIRFHNSQSDSSFTKLELSKRVGSVSRELPRFVIKELIESKISSEPRSQIAFIESTEIAERVVWIAPIREKPKRTYDNLKAGFSSEGSHTPYLINNILAGENKEARDELANALRKFGKNSGLFSEVKTKRFGKGATSPFEIDIVLNTDPLKITNVGYGVSQVLPIIVESFIQHKRATFAIQQPEVHLHPKAQAALGDFFYHLAKDEQKEFLLETHSDFLIDRFRQNVAKSSDSISSQVLFFHRGENGNECHSIKIEQDGTYSENQPKSFKEFFIKEQLAVLEI